MLALRVARVVEPVNLGRQVVHVIRNAVRLEQGSRILYNIRPERQLPRHVQLPGVNQQRDVRLLGEKADVSLLVHPRSEEYTSELQSRRELVCRLLLEKKKIVVAREPTVWNRADGLRPD